MGWCSGTEIFDVVCKALLSKKEINKKETIKTVINALEDLDWDCQSDSSYYKNPIVKAAFKELHPDWFEE